MKWALFEQENLNEQCNLEDQGVDWMTILKWNQRSRDSSVGIATGYDLNGPGSISDSTIFYTPHSVQTGSRAHPTSYPTGTGDSFSGRKATGA
jgi:hypothetical protein